ncbi:hypothetical protein GCG21_08805 [Pseudactinotalea sp. HY160]|uniref:hypothetical protein n=1 Tax=Pseudactinotalea sp. HY160 TaxID=2654490 RepID=UPI00128DAF8F|nr:hypothetical protein [Pseudactinotalea sp. HY160]MPV50104.1 hypothetical protein [Pseudactinotalea sp. HY160]
MTKRAETLRPCWWCGDVADTEEHKFKRSDLRRVAGASGSPQDVYKSSPTYTGTLKSLSKGSEIRWAKNLCAQCNNARSQPFDRAYDEFVNYVVENMDVLSGRDVLDWADVYGADWAQKVADMSRYLVKQFGCQLATSNLPVPDGALRFLNGADCFPDCQFHLWRDWRAIELHEEAMAEAPETGGMSNYIGLPPTQSHSRDGLFVGAEYGLQLGYVWLTLGWLVDAPTLPLHVERTTPMPLLDADARSQAEWRRLRREVEKP